jgi:CBS domain-containing protein
VHRKREFPVTISEDDYLLGAVTTKQAMNVPEQEADKVRVEQIMTLSKELIIMSSDRYADEALKRMYQENKSRIFVCTSSRLGLVEQKTLEQKGEISSSNSDKIKRKQQQLLQKGQQQLLKLIGIISKADILNIAAEGQGYEREVKKLSATNSDR